MTTTIELAAADGHHLSAYRSTPDNPRGGLVVLQEIFGVNSHIRALVDGFACDQRGSWDEASARQARERSLDVLLRYVG
ncbi:MAG: hypothetical protein P8Q36_17275 [Alphaproteobacteria bacterium]|jgi:hypothetical protein|nr:hypothetical protein [Alphaproteobacteria bacterium]